MTVDVFTRDDIGKYIVINLDLKQLVRSTGASRIEGLIIKFTGQSVGIRVGTWTGKSTVREIPYHLIESYRFTDLKIRS